MYHHLLQVLCIILTAIAMASSVAHAIELPGELQLSVEPYYVVQSIYYPGFTVGGMIGEPAAIVATVMLLLFASPNGAAFWLAAGALFALAGMQGLFWWRVQPLNKVWRKGRDMRRSASWRADKGRKSEFAQFGEFINQNWPQLRNQWEHIHLVRAGLAMLALILLIVSVNF